MTVSLGGVILSNYLALRGLDDLQPIAQSFRYTLSGGVVAQQLQITAGHTLTLVADESGGVITYKQSADVRALQAAGAAVVLSHGRGSYNVMIKRVSWSPLSTDFEAEVQDNDPGFGEIELIVKG